MKTLWMYASSAPAKVLSRNTPPIFTAASFRHSRPSSAQLCLETGCIRPPMPLLHGEHQRWQVEDVRAFGTARRFPNSPTAARRSDYTTSESWPGIEATRRHGVWMVLRLGAPAKPFTVCDTNCQSFELRATLRHLGIFQPEDCAGSQQAVTLPNKRVGKRKWHSPDARGGGGDFSFTAGSTAV